MVKYLCKNLLQQAVIKEDQQVKLSKRILISLVTIVLLAATCITPFATTGVAAKADDPADSYVKQTAANEDASISLWFEHSFKKVFTSDKTPSGMNTYSVYMAKNEIESAQFVL